MLYTLEHFRNTGEVLERLAKLVNADIRVTAPTEGSFFEEVQLYLAPIIADATTLHVPLDRLLAWVWSKVLPKSSENSNLARIAEKQADALGTLAVAMQDREKSAQAREETAQAQAQADVDKLRALTGILRTQSDGIRDNIDAAREIGSIVGRYSSAPQRVYDDVGEASFVAAELSSEYNRLKLVEKSEQELNRISPQDEQRLVDRVRLMVPDIGRPLIRSATTFQFEAANDRVPIAVLNRARVDQIKALHRDDTPINVTGNIQRLDKIQGFGRIKPVDSRTTLSFVIPRESLAEKRERFIDAFKAREVTLLALPYRDGLGNVVKLVALDVV